MYVLHFNVYGGFVGLHCRRVMKTWKLIPNYTISYKSKQLGVIILVVLAIVLERGTQCACQSYPVTSVTLGGRGGGGGAGGGAGEGGGGEGGGPAPGWLADGGGFHSNFAGDPAFACP